MIQGNMMGNAELYRGFLDGAHTEPNSLQLQASFQALSFALRPFSVAQLHTQGLHLDHQL